MAKKKKSIRIALNGFGRIGRAFFKQAWDDPDLEVVAINTRSKAEYYAHLLKYDSAFGIWDKEIKGKGKCLFIEGKEIPFFSEPDSRKLPWDEHKVDVVVDATGKHRKYKIAKNHIVSGARYVIVTSPMEDPDITMVYKLNHKDFDPKKHQIIAAASCTSVCAGLTLKVLEENFGVRQAMITTIHALTGSQQVIDVANKDLRKARAATESIIPTTTGAAKTLDKLFPKLKGRLSARSIRVPLVLPSLISMSVNLRGNPTDKEINQAFRRAARGKLKDSLDVTKLPLVSVDFKQNPHGAIIDLLSTVVVNDKLVNILAWYDNEWGYTTQTVKLIKKIAGKINGNHA